MLPGTGTMLRQRLPNTVPRNVNEPERHTIGAIYIVATLKEHMETQKHNIWEWRWNKWNTKAKQKSQRITHKLLILFLNLIYSLPFQIAPATFPTYFSCPTSISSARVRQQVALAPGPKGEVQHHPRNESCVVPAPINVVDIHGWVKYGKIS